MDVVDIVVLYPGCSIMDHDPPSLTSWDEVVASGNIQTADRPG